MSHSNGTWSFQLDPNNPHAATVVFPGGQKLRLHGYTDGRFRFRLHEAGPMTLLEAFMGGREKHVILTVAPIGWRPVEGAQEEAEPRPA